jgi:hypothetical protein
VKIIAQRKEKKQCKKRKKIFFFVLPILCELTVEVWTISTAKKKQLWATEDVLTVKAIQVLRVHFNLSHVLYSGDHYSCHELSFAGDCQTN